MGGVGGVVMVGRGGVVVVGVMVGGYYRIIFFKSDQRIPHAHLEGIFRVLKHL